MDYGRLVCDFGCAADPRILVRMEVTQVSQIAVQALLSGIVLAGITTFMGFGVGLAIELFKSYGGVR